MPKHWTIETMGPVLVSRARLKEALLAGVSALLMTVSAQSATPQPDFNDPLISHFLQQDDDDGGAGGGDDDDGGTGGGDDDGGAGGGDDDGGAGGGDDDDGGAGGGDDDDGGAGGGDDDDGGTGGGDDDAPTAGGGRDDDDRVRISRDDSERERAEFRDERGYRARSGEVLLIDPRASNLAASKGLGFTVLKTIRLPQVGVDAVILKTPRRMTTRDALRRLRRTDPTGRYDYNHLYDFRPTLELKSPYRPGEEEAPRRTLTKQSDLSIGIVDTAVYAGHPALKSARIEQKTFHRDGAGATVDHGTAVVSVMADNRDGLIPNSRFFVAGVFGTARQGDPVSSVVELANAIDWLVERNAAVINMSLAGPPNELLQTAVQRALAKGHAIVAAVGNAGPNSKPLYPAAYPGVVGVTATDVRGQIFRRAVQGQQVDFAAPGVSVRGANGGDAGESLYSGTSFAAPYVAAQIALTLKRPDLRGASAAIQSLTARAKDLGTPGRDDTYGHGLIAP